MIPVLSCSKQKDLGTNFWSEMSVFPESPALLVFLLDLQKENFLAPQTDKSMKDDLVE